MRMQWLLVISGLALAFDAAQGRADFEADLLTKFQKQNQATADRLRQEATRVLKASAQRDSVQKLLDQLHDDRALPNHERTHLIRKLQARLKSYQASVSPPPLQAAVLPPPGGPLSPTLGGTAAAAIATSGASVNVPDGGTRVLNSVMYASEGRNEGGVPGLGKLPYLGRGFRNIGSGRSLGSVQTSASVRIIIMEEEEAKFLRGK